MEGGAVSAKRMARRARQFPTSETFALLVASKLSSLFLDLRTAQELSASSAILHLKNL